jgi:murein peptide amidase A
MRVEMLLERLLEAARRGGFQSRIFARKGDYELPVLTRPAAEGGPAARIYISAGVHGDEPAGPLALLQALRQGAFTRALDWTLVPVVNPTGLAARKRENAEGIDLNRDYGSSPRSDETRAHLAWLRGRRFELALCLHEDFETDGAYLYELKPGGAPSHAPAILDAMRPRTGIETRPEIDGMPNRGGLMDPPREELLRGREDLPEALRFHHHHAPWCYTTETPSRQNIIRRVDAQLAALEVFGRLAREGAFGDPSAGESASPPDSPLP